MEVCHQPDVTLVDPGLERFACQATLKSWDTIIYMRSINPKIRHKNLNMHIQLMQFLIVYK